MTAEPTAGPTASKLRSSKAVVSKRRGSPARKPIVPGPRPGAVRETAVEPTVIALAAAVIAIANGVPVVEIVASPDSRDGDRLPSALFRMSDGRVLDEALRQPVESLTGHSVGYLQQLIAFLGTERIGGDRLDVTLIGYLALVHERRSRMATGRRGRTNRWQDCYQHLPWENWRGGRPQIIEDVIAPRLAEWARSGLPGLSKSALAKLQVERGARIRLAFAPSEIWDEDKVLVRFDLLTQAGLIVEDVGLATHAKKGGGYALPDPVMALGRPLFTGHRRILAAGIGRLRTDLKTRPAVFELMDDAFSLLELQQTVEAILGPNLHKQNFRRLIETAGLVEPTGEMRSHTGGRPAKLYRFRRDVLLERPAPGLKIRT